MSKIFVPYKGKKPVPVVINGHKLLILSREREDLEESLKIVGGTDIKSFDEGDTQEEQDFLLNKLSQMVKGGVVVAPSDVKVPEIIRNLQEQLPWVQ
jgi:C-terminal processing protease CtpA/Prc